jgi:16S rRNA (adenine1518-N6/adenine1519-N6)-dimethyltransferase
VLRLLPREEPLVGREHFDDFVATVQAGFAQPRKTLRNSLAQGLGTTTAEATIVLERAGIDPGRRPQELTVEDWVRLHERR